MELIPEKTVDNPRMEGRITKTSRFFQLLIKICFIPVSVTNNKIVFKVFSFKMMSYILCALLVNFFLSRVMYLFTKEEDIDRFLSEVKFYIS